MCRGVAAELGEPVSRLLIPACQGPDPPESTAVGGGSALSFRGSLLESTTRSISPLQVVVV